MTIVLTVVLMLLVGTLCFMLGAFAQESSGIFQFRDRTEETTREIVIKLDTENLKEGFGECFNEVVKTIEDYEHRLASQYEEDKDEE